MVDPGLTSVYVAALAVSGTVALAVGLWAYASSDADGREWFLSLMLVDTLWVTSAAVGLLVTDPGVTRILFYLKAVFAVLAGGTWYVFATVYTGRPLRRWSHVAVLAPLALAVVTIVTNPVHHLHWPTLAYRTEPLSFVAATETPLRPLINLWVFVVIGGGLYYVGELFVKSRHRARLSLAILLCGTVAASLPNVATNLGLVPVPAYDHTALGVVAFAVAAGYAIFGLGMFDIRPLARDNLVDEVDDALLVLDEEGRVIDYNAASERLSDDLAEGDPIGSTLATVCPPVAAAVSLPAASETFTTDVISAGSEDPAHYSGRVTPITENGETVGYSVILRDVTTRVEYRRELEQRNEQLDQFASTVAHDLRNPLQVAFGRARLLEDGIADGGKSLQRSGSGGSNPLSDEGLESSVAALTDSLERMDEIIQDLRTLAEKGQTVDERRPVPIADAADDAWGTVATDGATLRVESSGTVEADRSRLLSVLENLFANAVEHGSTSPASPVTVRVGLTDGGFYVADDGSGVPVEDRERIFEYGYSGGDGTGLGLAIVHTMATAHGWEVSVTDSADGGARFEITGASTELARDAKPAG